MTTVATNDTVAPDQKDGIVHLTSDGQDVVILHLGAATETVLTLTERRLDSLKEVLLRLQGDSSVKGVIVTGPGPGMFAAGADISVIEAIEDQVEGERAAVKGQSIFGMFQELQVPVVGAIEGPCLGGGLEMALCFDVRVASDHAATLIGLPEVKLGIIPGFGGTQRLSRLVGLPRALDLILAGKTLKPKKALRAGIIDRIVPAERLLDAARQEIQKLIDANTKHRKRRQPGLVSRLGVLRKLVRRKVMKKLTTGQARFYEAPRAALDLCLDAFALPVEEGLAREAHTLGRLIVGPTCKALVRLYYLTEQAKRLGKRDGVPAVDVAHIVGAGAMGAGIAGLLASRGIRVRLCDLSGAALAAAKQRLHNLLGKRLKRRNIESHTAQATEDRLAVSTEWGRLDQVDFCLEAVVEKLEVKQQLFAAAVEAGLPEAAILATNTSSLPVDDMASGLPAPGRVIGMHFFNPPEKMPLVEVIVGPRTEQATIDATCKLAVRLGKFPVVCKDSPGFLINRCLAPYMNEAARLMVEGCDPKLIDQVMLDFGLPMGPARLMDEVGFDVAGKVSEVMSAAFPDRMQPSELFDAMVAAGRLGKKSGGGILSAGGHAVLKQLSAGAESTPSRSTILERLIYPMVDEAYRCLDDGIVASEDDLDLGLVMGMGFPPFTGGISRYARSEGIDRIIARLDDLAAGIGERFRPGNGLRQRVSQGGPVSE